MPCADVIVSIVIPVYNGELYIEQTIRSLLSQTLLNFEIICVDDSSTDNSLKIIEQLRSIDDRIKIYTKANGGIAASAVKFGLQYSTGEFFMYASQDDLFSPDLLEKGVESAKKFGSDAIVPEMFLYYSDTDLRPFNSDKRLLGTTITGKEAFTLSLKWTIHGFVLWRMDTVKKVGYFDFNISSDEYTTRMLFYNSTKVSFSDGVFYYRQNNPNAITKKWNINQIGFVETNLKLLFFLEENNFTEKEFLVVGKNVLNELVRVNTLYWKNRALMDNALDIKYQIAMTALYHEAMSAVRNLKLEGLKLIFRFLFVTNGYRLFSIFCRIKSKITT
ncbi:glycosyltransferase family 2 protein [Mucilaginibacter psychrotolerans]|uniref:Glycosyltransferase family 2 protein n=1 Tax=Mucilaginibacter psychrotolerans TaxID=1524096 RepID=A0A4Y8SA67_9SPHI|nr:glycosyltransferase family 2 protein [Mucilaginibacter psychrotolerans]TFF35525.1 glycosyltransferase family 2 protein [Mucilaginibacter psychrotolerans]